MALAEFFLFVMQYFGGCVPVGGHHISTFPLGSQRVLRMDEPGLQPLIAPYRRESSTSGVVSYGRAGMEMREAWPSRALN
jgi:hypothetical protein